MSKRINPYKKYHGSFIPEWLLPRSEISSGAKLCFARLARFAGEGGKAYPKIKTLADKLGVSKRQCSSYLKELKDVGLIEAEQQGLGQPNVYYFLEHKWEKCHLNDSDRMKDTSTQGGSKVHDKDEENCNTGMKNTSFPIDKESHNKESHNKRESEPTLPEKIEQCETVKALSDIWFDILKEKNRWPKLSQQEMIRHDMKQWGLSKSKKIVKVAASNGWLSLKEDYISSNESSGLGDNNKLRKLSKQQ